MPETEVVIFAENDGTAPLLKWLDGFPTKVQDKVLVRIERLKECGHELGRPEAALLRDGIYELRVRYGRTNYRVLYFFHEQRAILSHGTIKEKNVPPLEIDRAVERRAKFGLNPKLHTYRERGS